MKIELKSDALIACEINIMKLRREVQGIRYKQEVAKKLDFHAEQSALNAKADEVLGFIDDLIEIRTLLENYDEKNRQEAKELKDLRFYRDSTVGLFATDKEDWVPKNRHPNKESGKSDTYFVLEYSGYDPEKEKQQMVKNLTS